MIRKCHNRTLQSNPRHREGEPQNIYSNKTLEKTKKQSDHLPFRRKNDWKTREYTKQNIPRQTNTKTRYLWQKREQKCNFSYFRNGIRKKFKTQSLLKCI